MQAIDDLLVVTGSSDLKKSISLIKHSIQGFILLRNEVVPPELTVVVSGTFGAHTYALCSYVSGRPFFISISSA